MGISVTNFTFRHPEPGLPSRERGADAEAGAAPPGASRGTGRGGRVTRLEQLGRGNIVDLPRGEWKNCCFLAPKSNNAVREGTEEDVRVRVRVGGGH